MNVNDPKTSLSAALAVAAALGGLLAPGTASAQTTPGTGTTITVNPVINRNTTPPRPDGLKTNQINANDCLADVTLQFTLQISGTISANYRLEAWVGSGDCSPLTARNGTNTSICWPVLPGPVTAQNTTPMNIRVRDIVANLSVPQKPILYTEAGDEACSAQATPGQTTLNLYFLFLDGANNPGASAATPIDIDMVGPDSPNDVTAGEADRVIVARWTQTTTSGSDRTGYNVYCAPVDTIENTGTDEPGGQVICEDGGFTDAGVDEEGNPLPGEPIDGGCTFVPDEGAGSDPTCPKPPLSALCGSVGQSGEARLSDNIENGRRYTVAVAAVDKFGNPGPLSNSACVTPGPVADFFNNYRGAGGQAGGCALEGVGLPASGGVAFVGGAATLAALLRRVIRRRKNDT